MRKETRKISLPRKFADDVKLRSRIDKLEGKVLTGWKNGNPEKSPTYAGQRRKANDRVPLLPSPTS